MGIIEELASLRGTVESLARTVGRHSRVPEQRWGTVTTFTTGSIKVTFPGEAGEAIITRSSELVWLGALVLVQIQGNDRWITGVTPHSQALTGASDLDTTLLDGSYAWTGTPAHRPTGAGTAGWLEVITPNGVTQQRASDSSGNVWVRSLAVGVWTAWTNTSGWTLCATQPTWPGYFVAYGTSRLPKLWAQGTTRCLRAGTFQNNATWAANTAYSGAWGPAAGDRSVDVVECGLVVRVNATMQTVGFFQFDTVGNMTWVLGIGGSPGSSAIDVPDVTWSVV